MTAFAPRSGLALGLVLAAAAAAPAQQNGSVFAVLVADTNSADIRDGIKKDCEIVAALLETVSGGAVRTTHLSGTDTTRAKFESTIAALPVRPGDTLFCFIACHGATSEMDGRHFLQFTGQKAATGKPEFIPRDFIRDVLTRKGARLTVLLTDACSNKCAVSLAPPPGPGPRPKVLANSPPKKCYSKLFLEPRGLVDISGSYEGTYAWFHDKEGGVFTRALDVAFRQVMDDENVSWAGFYGELKDATQKTYIDWKARWLNELGEFGPRNSDEREAVALLRAQASQTTQVFYLTDTRLKLIFDGGKVTDLPLDSPARKAGIQVDDVIERVNGKTFRDDDELFALLSAAMAARAASTIKVTVRRGNKSYELTVQVPAN